MDPQRELGVILRAITIGLFSPEQLEAIRAEWEAGSNSSFIEFLVKRGTLTPEQLHELETLSQKSSLQTPPSALPTTRPEKSGEGALTVPYEPAPAAPGTGKPAPVPPRLDGVRYRNCKAHEVGGLGQIWKVDDEVLGRTVALKTLRGDRALGRTVRARFTREARITGQLEHPGVVPVYDLIPLPPEAGATEALDFCYTMRFIDGRTLAAAAGEYHGRRARSEAGPLELAGLLDAFVSVCRTVGFAHDREILHRDLKGQNVILGKHGETFVLDWGLGKRVDELPEPADTPDEPTIDFAPAGMHGPTKAGSIVGTPAYMSPQVAAGAPATKSSDIYGLGAILYSVLTGSAPYSGPTPEAIVAKVVKGPPLRPRLWNPAISPALEAVCLKAMARDPADRYATAEELADEVRRWLADEPVTAYRDRLSTRTLRWAKRHRATVFAGTAFLVTALIGSSVAAVMVWKEKERTDVQRLAFLKNYGLARAQSFAAIELMEKSEYLFVANAELAASRKKVLVETAKAFRTFLDQSPDDPELVAKSAVVFRYAANVHRFENEHKLAEPLYVDAIATLRKLREQEPDEVSHRVRLSDTLRDQSQSVVVLGRLKDAESLLKESLEISEGLLKGLPANPVFQRLVASAQLDMCGIWHGRGRIEEQVRAAERAVELFRVLKDVVGGSSTDAYYPLLYGFSMNRLSVSLRESGDIKRAAAQHQETMKFMRELVESKPKGIVGYDLNNAYAKFALDQAETNLLDANLEPKPEVSLKEAIRLWEILLSKQPWLKVSFKAPIYQLNLTKAYRVRGAYILAASKYETGVADLDSGLRLSAQLVRDYPDIPEYHVELARCQIESAKAKRTGEEGARKLLLGQARKNLSIALLQSPDDVEIRKLSDGLKE